MIGSCGVCERIWELRKTFGADVVESRRWRRQCHGLNYRFLWNFYADISVLSAFVPASMLSNKSRLGKNAYIKLLYFSVITK